MLQPTEPRHCSIPCTQSWPPRNGQRRQSAHYLPLITIAHELNTRITFSESIAKVSTQGSLLCTQQPTSPRWVFTKQTFLRDLFFGKSQCHDVPNFGSQLHKVLGLKKAKLPSVVLFSSKAEVGYHKPIPSKHSSQCPQPAAHSCIDWCSQICNSMPLKLTELL